MFGREHVTKARMERGRLQPRWGLGQHCRDKQGRRPPSPGSRAHHAGWPWDEGQSKDVAHAVPQLYGDSLGCSAGAPDLRGSQNVTWERSGPSAERLWNIRRDHLLTKLSFPCPTVVLPLCISAPARHKPPEWGQHPSVTPRPVLNMTWESGSCRVLHPTGCPSRTVTSNKAQCPHDLLPSAAHDFQKPGRCAQLVHLSKLPHGLALISFNLLKKQLHICYEFKKQPY